MVHSSIAPLVISEERSYRVRVALQPKSMYAGSHSEPAAIDSLVDGEVTLGALLRLQHQEASPATTATPIEAVFSCGDVRVVARFASRTARTPTGIRSESTAMAFELMAEELSGLHANY